MDNKPAEERATFLRRRSYCDRGAKNRKTKQKRVALSTGLAFILLLCTVACFKLPNEVK